MAKVPFSKLQAGIDGQVSQISYKDKSEKEVCYEVKHYLPFRDKLEMITKIINQSVDDNGFYNPMRVKLYTVLEVIYAYTNLSFTEKQKEDPFKLYDLLISTGIFMDVLKEIAEHDWADIQDSIKTTIDNIYNYRNSVMGILEAVSADYSDLNLDADILADKVLNPESLATLKELLPLVQ
jgi:hypothetical protein